jgi:aspartyl-tRNA(Asn)/glutamyl-tRNA(Gln) amidotransferase subunit A
MDLTQASFKKISESVKEKKISATEVVGFFLKRIEANDHKINSFITVNSQALALAAEVDTKIARGEAVGPLAGVPFAVKDMFCTKGVRTTAASKMLANFVPPYDATVVHKLKQAGAIIVGKLNQDEFAMGSSNETSAFGPCRNPWNPDYVAGGSSGGSAAAQAARLVAGTLGTDTGGSIRQPASFCGVVGVKPTYGRVSRYGIIAYASSLDQAGPMTSNVEDAALALEVICGKDERDATTSNQKVPRFSENLKISFRNLKIGVLKENISSGLHEDVAKIFQVALREAEAQGAQIIELAAPLTKYAVPVYYLVAASEASSNLARYDGVKYGHRSCKSSTSETNLENFYSANRAEGFGHEVKRRIMIGTYCLSSGYIDEYYTKASKVRRMLRSEYIDVLKKCDVILSPVATTPAFKLGEKISDPLAMYLNDIFTVSTNLAGLPGMSVPFGYSKEGLPIGIQLTAAHFEEEKLLQAAQCFENLFTDYRRPHVF